MAFLRGAFVVLAGLSALSGSFIAAQEFDDVSFGSFEPTGSPYVIIEYSSNIALNIICVPEVHAESSSPQTKLSVSLISSFHVIEY